jgi:hypothetical protein
MTTVWAVVIVFIAVAAGAAIAMLASAWGDKKVADEVAGEPDRLDVDPSRDVGGVRDVRDVRDGPDDEPGEHHHP